MGVKQMNVTVKLYQNIESMSYQPTTEIKEADVIVLNTCAIRENAEEKVFGKVGYVKI